MSLIAAFHPTYAFWHNPYEWAAFDGDVRRFGRLIKGTLEKGPHRVSWKPRAKDVVALHRWALRTGQPVACDIETGPERSGKEWAYTGKDPTRCVLRMVGVGNTTEGMGHWWKDDSPGVKTALWKLLADKRVAKVFHNGYWFDHRVLARYGFVLRNLWDSRDARRALSATSSLKLSYVTSLYVDAHPWKEDESDDEKGLVFTKSRKKLGTYNSYDCVYTARSWRGITSEPEWKSVRVQRLYQVHTDLARIAAEMHTNGFKIDALMRRWMAWALKKEGGQREKQVVEAVNVDGFECTPNHLRALIFKRHAVGKYAHLARFNLQDPLDPAMYVDPKEPSTISVGEDALTLLLIDPDTPADLKRIIKIYWLAQKVKKRRSTFVVSKLVSEALGKDGRIRAGWNSCGTDTGRFSCSKPNLMNIEQQMRAMYVAEEGHLLIGADYSQLELRVMAAVTGDKVLEAALTTGDVYTEDAKDFFGLDRNLTKKQIKPEARKAAKIIHLAKQYGAGKKKVYQQALPTALEENLDLEWDTVAALCSAFDKRYFATVKYWEEEHARVCASSYSASRILDRRRVYPREPDRPETANYPIQATASDIKNLALIAVDKSLRLRAPQSKIVVDLHDAIYVEAREQDAILVETILRDCMEVPHTIDGKVFNFPIESKIANRWDAM